jgi:tetratricopeptide (TPR) repeat protein
MLAFVEHVMEWSGGLPILILCTARSDLFDKDPGWGRGKRNWSTVTLAPLADEDARTLVSALLPPGSPTPLQRLVVERSGGNPLFAEEFAQMLREQPTPDPGGASPSHQLLAPHDTPASLHALIAARLDTLTLSLKSLLLDSSVIGRTFWAGALTSMSGLDRDVVHAQLRELARKELIRPSRASSVREEAEYAFWHTLIRDVAYGQIPRARRAPKHIAVAEWIERMAGERVSDRAELLAYHYGQALDLIRATGASDEIATLEAITRRYWMLAGERAMGLDVARAAECFERAMELFPPTDPGRADVVARLAAAAFDSGRIRDAQAAYEQAIDLFDENDDRLARGRSLDRLATVLWEQGDTAGSRIRLAQAVELLEAEPHGSELADCYTSLASDRMVSGRFDEALAWAERSISLSSELGAEHLRPRALGFRGVAKCYRGDLAGLDDLHAAIAIAERLGLARDQANVLVILAEVLWATDGPSAALEAVERASALATRRGLGDVVVACRTQSLGPLFDLGRWDDVLTIADDVIRWSESTGGGYYEITSQLWQGQVLVWREQRSPETSIADLMIPAREIADPQVLVPAVVVSGLIAVEENRPDEVERLIEELERATDVGLGWYREHFLLDLVRLCVFAGDLASASRFVDRADAFTTRHRLALLGARAVIDEARGALPDAAAIYREVELGWASYGNLLEEGRAALGVGRCLARSGEQGARPELLRAREIFEQLGAPRLLDEADTHLVESGRR